MPNDSLDLLFRTRFIAPKHVGSRLQTYVTFGIGPERRGGYAAHRARWVFSYDASGRADSAAFHHECLPAIAPRTPFAVYLVNFTQPIAGAQFIVAGRETLTNARGQVWIDSMIVGAYPVSVRAAGVTPVDTVLLVDGFGHELYLRPR